MRPHDPQPSSAPLGAPPRADRRSLALSTLSHPPSRAAIGRACALLWWGALLALIVHAPPPASAQESTLTAPPASALLQPLTPEEAAVFPFQPPIGVLDAIDLSVRLRGQLTLALEETPINDKRLARCRRAIDELLLFTMQEDEWRSSLDEYTWYLAGSIELEDPGPSRRVLRLEPPIDNAQAIALRAENGRVLTEQIAALGADDEELEFTERTLYLRRDVPRRHVTHLERPARLRQVQLTLSTDAETDDSAARRPVVVIYVGASEVPEYGKSAIRELLEARTSIEEFRFRDAIGKLQRAESDLLAFRRLSSGESADGVSGER